MGLFSRLAKPKYKDDQINVRAESALTEDPMIGNATTLQVVSEKGIVRLMGSVANEREKAHVEGTVRSALKQSGLQFARIENQLSVNR